MMARGDMNLERHAALAELLGDHAEDEALEVLTDRAHDAGHLEEEDYGRLTSEEAQEDEALLNLKRHVLFCDLCAEEFLRRALPAAEEAFQADDVLALRRKLLRRLPWMVAAILAGLLAWRLWPHQEPEPLPGPPPFMTPVSVLRPAVGRLAMELRAGTGSGGAWVYAFLIAEGRVRPLHPDPLGGYRNPLPAGQVPSEGWPDPGGKGPRMLLVLVAEGVVPVISSKRGMETLGARFAQELRAGRSLEEVRAALAEVAGSVRGDSFLLPVDS